MKKLLIAIMVAVLPVCVETASAQLFARKDFQGRKDRKEYMQGAVPQANGKVVFTKEFATAKNAYDAIRQWAGLRYMPNTQQGTWLDANYFNNGDFALAETPDKSTIVCTGDEELVFTNKALARDASRVNYKLTLSITDTKVVATMTDIAYTYNLTDVPERIPAEDWIVDSEAFSKKGDLLRRVAKFRIKTIDLVDELFAEIESNVK